MRLFFNLLQAALWDAHPDATLFEHLPSDEWSRIYQYARQQALLGIIYDAMMRLPLHLQPERNLRLKWFLAVQKIEQTNEHLNHTVALFSEEMKKHDIHFLLLKGQGVATFYPNPLHRQSGDIDLYFLTLADYRKAFHWIKMQNLLPTVSVKHISVEWNDAHLEFHARLKEMHHPISNYYLQRFIAQYRHEKGNESIFIAHTEVAILSPESNLIYMMLHIFSHLMTGGIGLRQFCDWACYAAAHSHQINRIHLNELIQKTGLSRFANAFAYIQVEYLGLSPQHLPFTYKPDTTHEELLNDILTGGNFGTYHSYGIRPSGRWVGKWYTFCKITKRVNRFFRLNPSEAICLPISYLFWNIRFMISNRSL